MQGIQEYFENLMHTGIRQSRWFRSAPAEFQKTAVIRILGVEDRRFHGIMASAMRPALVAECECGGEVQKFSMLIENSGLVEQVD